MTTNILVGDLMNLLNKFDEQDIQNIPIRIDTDEDILFPYSIMLNNFVTRDCPSESILIVKACKGERL